MAPILAPQGAVLVSIALNSAETSTGGLRTYSGIAGHRWRYSRVEDWVLNPRPIHGIMIPAGAKKSGPYCGRLDRRERVA